MEMKSQSFKAQSAMEYLMTYGWSILIIAIALVTLFELGLFNTTGLSGTSTCIVQTGYLCSSVSLSTNGILSADVGSNYGTTITVSGVTCTTNSTPSVSSFNGIAPIKINNGGEVPLSFYCPLTSNTVGSPFNGKLWILYSDSSSSQQIAEIGVVSAKTTASSTTQFSGSFGNNYVPITLTNQQSSSVSTNFQQMIYFNPSTYSTYENSNLSNIEVTSGEPIGTSGNVVLNSWIESGASSSASNTVMWINLGGTTIGAYKNYISVNVINSQSTATGTNFQQMVYFNPSSYSSYEASDLGNIRFYYGNTELYSWCESGCSSTSSNAIFWVNTNSLNIGANSYAIINLTFEPTSTEYDGVYAGEAPQLSSTYGQYDNGATVFSLYDNFKGTSLDSNWEETQSGGTFSVNNGLVFSTNYQYFNVTSTNKYNPSVVDAGVFMPSVANNEYININFGYATVLNPTNYVPQNAYVSSFQVIPVGGKVNYVKSAMIINGAVFSNGAGATGGAYTANYIVSFEWPSTGSQTLLYNYTEYSAGTNTLFAWSNAYIHLDVNPQAYSPVYVYWIRSRSYPPNGVMPTFQLSGVQTTSGQNTATIYLNFLSGNYPVSSGYTGYAPQLYCSSGCSQSSYAQYDNGGSVFNNYWNFAGTTLPIGWTYYSGSEAVYTVNNGLTISSTTGYDSSLYYSTTPYNVGNVLDFYGDIYQSSGTGYVGFSTGGNCNELGVWMTAISGGIEGQQNGCLAGYHNPTSVISTSSSNTIYTLAIGSADSVGFSYNYGNYYYTASSTNGITSTSYPEILTQGLTNNLYFQYMRIRNYPPDGVMPQFSLGTLK